MKTKTQYYIDVDEWQDVEIPFLIEEDTVISKTVGDKFFIGALRHDEMPEDPITHYDYGKFYQFNWNYIHHIDRPSPEDFKTLIRQNPGKIVLVYGDAYRGTYHADDAALTVKDTKGKNAKCYEVGDAQGYYISPEDAEDAEDAARYAKGAMDEYTAYCQGDCYRVCIFEYAIIETDNGKALEYITDDCVWGFYGSKYAEEELKRMLAEA